MNKYTIVIDTVSCCSDPDKEWGAWTSSCWGATYPRRCSARGHPRKDLDWKPQHCSRSCFLPGEGTSCFKVMLPSWRRNFLLLCSTDPWLSQQWVTSEVSNCGLHPVGSNLVETTLLPRFSCCPVLTLPFPLFLLVVTLLPSGVPEHPWSFWAARSPTYKKHLEKGD